MQIVKGEEGKYYLFSSDELENANIPNFKVFSKFFNINPISSIYNDKFILFRTDNTEKFMSENNYSLSQIKIKEWNDKLINIRKTKDRPRIDKKFISSWNAILMKGLISSYNTFNDTSSLNLAIRMGDFFINKLQNKGLYHIYNKDIGKIDGYLEDYANLISALIKMYEASSNYKWILYAKNLTELSFKKFYNNETNLFFFNEKNDAYRTTEITDNVIPSSNSIMAENLFLLSNIIHNEDYKTIAYNMLNKISNNDNLYITNLSNWARLKTLFTRKFYQVVIVGEKAEEIKNKMLRLYIPNKIVLTSKKGDNKLDIFKNKYKKNKTLIYVCLDNVCKYPTESINECFRTNI